jgi:hypothetical protein
VAAVAAGSVLRLLLHALGSVTQPSGPDVAPSVDVGASASKPSSLPAIPAPRSVRSVDVPSVDDLFARTGRRLLADMREVERDDKKLLGWSHNFGGGLSPSAIGTSYGLRAGLALDIRDIRFDRHQLVETVLQLQRPGGGWAARSQRDSARPEVTSWVLTGAAAGGLDADRRKAAVKLLEGLLDAGTDAVGMTRTTVVTAALCCLARTAPDSEAIGALARSIRSAALRPAGDGTQFAWGEALGAKDLRPSAPHTARTIVALCRARQTAVGQSLQLNELIDGGIDWLDSHRDLGLVEEPIKRPAGELTDALFVGHFTPAWVAQAVMAAGRESRNGELLRLAVRAVLDEHKDGVWVWQNHGTEPVWMTYQGIIALRDYAMRNLPWRP